MGDSGYTGVHKREENLGLAVDWQVAMDRDSGGSWHRGIRRP